VGSRGKFIKIKNKNCFRFFLIYIIFLFTINVIYPQTWSFQGEGIITPSYVWVIGDTDLFQTQNVIYPGLNYQIKGRFTLNQIYEDLNFNFNYSTGYTSQDQIYLNIKYKNIEGIFSNNFQDSLSYLTLWNKNINGFELRYKEGSFSLKALLTKSESSKKQKIFYGNDSSGPYIISDFNLVPGRERVYLNGRLLERDVDYIIDYEYGILYFSEVISSQDLIVIEYEVFGLIRQIYNLLGLKIDYKDFSFSFLNLDDPNSKTQRRFLELSFLRSFNESYIGFSVSQGLMENALLGRAYNFSFKYKSQVLNLDGQSLKVDDNYPYIKEIMGNYEVIPGIFRNKINLKYSPLSSLKYNMSFLREDYENFYQSINQDLTLNLGKI